MRIAFIGLGIMGGPMASNILKAEHDLVVHDVRRAAADALLERGGRWADSPAEAAREAELILTSLPGPKEVEVVALGERGIGQSAPAGSIYADLSTSSPTLIRRIHAVLGERGVAVLDAPVSGGPLGAQQGTLQIMVGGDEAAFDRARPALAAIGDKITYIGASGAGCVAKLVHNMISYGALLAVAEGFTLGVKAGVKPEKLLEAVSGGAYGRGNLLGHRVPNLIMKGAFDRPDFALALARKDIGLATALAREFDVPMAVASLAEQEMIAALVRGWAKKDSSAIFKLQEERAGVEVRASQVPDRPG
jgi:3-hydroxyisobutyrate dehydrogenase